MKSRRLNPLSRIAAVTFATDDCHPKFTRCVEKHRSLHQLLAILFHSPARLAQVDPLTSIALRSSDPLNGLGVRAGSLLTQESPLMDETAVLGIRCEFGFPFHDKHDTAVDAQARRATEPRTISSTGRRSGSEDTGSPRNPRISNSMPRRPKASGNWRIVVSGGSR